jgi:hypothetical protein
MKYLPGLIFIIGFLSVLFSCDTECAETPKNFMYLEFRSSANKLKKFKFDTIYIEDVNLNLVKESDSISNVIIPLRPDLKETTVIFSKNNIPYKLQLSYDNIPFNMGEGCGFAIKINSFVILEHNFDSVLVLNNTIYPNYAKSHLAVYFY